MELEELLDRSAIADVLTRYTLAVDRGAWDDLDEVFTQDAHVDYTASGGTVGTYPDVKAWLAQVLPPFTTRTMHTLGQVAVSFAQDRASAEVSAYFHNPMVIADGSGGERVVEVGGIYRHTFVRTDAGWRSRRLLEEVVWTHGF